jgi:hypothetical protein
MQKVKKGNIQFKKKNVLINIPTRHAVHLAPVRAEDELLAAAKVRVHLARQQRVLRDVRAARVAVARQQQQPRDAHGNAQQRQVRRQLRDDDGASTTTTATATSTTAAAAQRQQDRRYM